MSVGRHNALTASGRLIHVSVTVDGDLKTTETAMPKVGVEVLAMLERLGFQLLMLLLITIAMLTTYRLYTICCETRIQGQPAGQRGWRSATSMSERP